MKVNDIEMPDMGMAAGTGLEDFDRNNGNLLERLVFNNRGWIIGICVLLTLIFGFQATKLTVNASFEKMLPQFHPYIQNYLKYKKQLPLLGNNLRVIVENPKGDIYDKDYLEVLRKLNDDLFLTPGVDRPAVKSLWSPAVRWTIITEQGFQGGSVMPDGYNGSPESVAQLKRNVELAGLIGNLVSSDLKSTMILVPLLDFDPATNLPLDYHTVSKRLDDLRQKYQAEGVTIHVVGFAKLIGDLIDGLEQVLAFFAIAILVCGIIIWLHTRCIRSTLLVLLTSGIAVIWLLGALAALHIPLDPYLVLIPFLVFAIGVSHGAQKMNGIMQDVGRGTHRYVAARFTFRRLFLAGFTALMADVVGFAVLMLIDIPVIKDLALISSVGVALLVFTNLVLLPVLLSYVGVSHVAAERSLRGEEKGSASTGLGKVWNLLDRFTGRRWAIRAVAVAAALAATGYAVSLGLKVGDLDAGASELRPDSRYNRDVTYLQEHYSLSSDQFAVIATAPTDGLRMYPAVLETDRLTWALRQVEGVQGVDSYSDRVRLATAGLFEGSPKWMTVNPNQDTLNANARQLMGDDPFLFDTDLSVTPIVAYLTDHKAETLQRVLLAVEEFNKGQTGKDIEFKLAAGSAGIEAATNDVVGKALREMLFYVYGAVVVLCYVTFRSWRAVIVAVVPLAITSILCEALMVVLGMGVKVGTLPVMAVGVGIGVDYALYLLSIQLGFQRQGMTLEQAYSRALRSTGKVVAFVGITLAAGVGTWALSPLKFQADMGVLLTFMFLLNMIGALVLIPALSSLLLRGVGVQANKAEGGRLLQGAGNVSSSGAI